MPGNQVTINDLSLAAYAVLCGAKPIIVKKLGKTFSFTLELNELSMQQIRTRFLTSESAKFDAIVRDFKRVLYSGNR